MFDRSHQCECCCECCIHCHRHLCHFIGQSEELSQPPWDYLIIICQSLYSSSTSAASWRHSFWLPFSLVVWAALSYSTPYTLNILILLAFPFPLRDPSVAYADDTARNIYSQEEHTLRAGSPVHKGIWILDCHWKSWHRWIIIVAVVGILNHGLYYFLQCHQFLWKVVCWNHILLLYLFRPSTTSETILIRGYKKKCPSTQLNHSQYSHQSGQIVQFNAC